MGNPLSLKHWSPYLVGAGIGVLSWFSFATADKPIGITTAFEYMAALAESAAAPHLVQSYLAEQTRKGREPKIDWEWMLVLGVFLGAYVSPLLLCLVQTGLRLGEALALEWSDVDWSSGTFDQSWHPLSGTEGAPQEWPVPFSHHDAPSSCLF